MKKKIIMCILAVGLLTGCGEIPKLENGKDAIVEFKDKSMISVDDVWSDMKDQYALSVLLTKIDKQILESEYKDKLKDMEEYVKNYETYLKTNYVDENGNFDQSKLDEALSNAGVASLEVLLEQQGLTYLNDIAVEDYAKTQITDKQISDYYKNEAVGDIHCVHILVEPEGTDTANLTKALEKANKVIEDIQSDINSGTKAEDAFKKYEKDKSVKYQDLDYFNKGDMVEEFEKEAYALKKGEYTSKPLKTSYGYHVILKIDEKEKDTLDNLKDDIKETLAKKLINDDKDTSINAMVELRKKYGVKFHDSKLEEQYNRYINSQLNSN